MGETVRPDIRYRLRPGAYAILMRGGAMLLTATDEWQLPGGGIDAGESPVRALHREVREETGWRIAGARRLGAFRRFAFMPDYDRWAEKLCHIYVARPTRAIGPPTEPDHRAVWLPVAEAADRLTHEGERWFLRRFLR